MNISVLFFIRFSVVLFLFSRIFGAPDIGLPCEVFQTKPEVCQYKATDVQKVFKHRHIKLDPSVSLLFQRGVCGHTATHMDLHRIHPRAIPAVDVSKLSAQCVLKF